MTVTSSRIEPFGTVLREWFIDPYFCRRWSIGGGSRLVASDRASNGVHAGSDAVSKAPSQTASSATLRMALALGNPNDCFHLPTGGVHGN
jgi:hypothetical protein